MIDFELSNVQPDIISLSWHLTRREKNKVMESMHSPKNKLALKKFLGLFNEEVSTSSNLYAGKPDLSPN